MSVYMLEVQKCGPAQSPPRCTKCNSRPINSQCTNFGVAL